MGRPLARHRWTVWDSARSLAERMGPGRWWTVALLAAEVQLSTDHTRRLLARLVEKGAAEHRLETWDDVGARIDRIPKRGEARWRVTVFRATPARMPLDARGRRT